MEKLPLVQECHVAVEIPDDRLITAIAEEDGITDRDLDDLERRILDPGLDPAITAALALTLGRAGRPSSVEALARARLRLEAKGHPLEAKAVRLASEVLQLQPPPQISRAERGYRRVDAAAGETLYVEDPLAAHWHREHRWGPPLRPEPEREQVFARGEGQVDRLVELVRAGAIVIVGFQPSRLSSRSEPVFRLMRCGFSRDPLLRTLVRWAEVRSVGCVESWLGPKPAYEAGQGPVVLLPRAPTIPVTDLVALMTRLLKQARPC